MLSISLLKQKFGFLQFKPAPFVDMLNIHSATTFPVLFSECLLLEIFLSLSTASVVWLDLLFSSWVWFIVSFPSGL